MIKKKDIEDLKDTINLILSDWIIEQRNKGNKLQELEFDFRSYRLPDNQKNTFLHGIKINEL